MAVVMEREYVVAMSFGQWVRTRREERGITQREVGERMGLDSTYVSRIERGAVNTWPTPDEARRWARALETTIEDLMRSVGYLPEEEQSEAEVFASMVTTVSRAESLPPRLKRIMLETIEMAREQASQERHKDE